MNAGILCNDGQLSMIQVGIMLADFFPNELPEDLEKVTEAVFDNFGVVIEQGEALSVVRDKIRDAASLNSIAMRWHEKQEDGWNKIEDTGLPEEGRWYDTYTWTRDGHRTVRELFLDGEVDGYVHWLGDGDWLYPVSHWKERTDPPKKEE